jgi:hypothetical protein
VRADDDPAKAGRAELDDRTFVVRGRSTAGQDGRRQQENGDRQQPGEAHTIDLLHDFLSEKLTFVALETPASGAYSRSGGPIARARDVALADQGLLAVFACDARSIAFMTQRSGIGAASTVSLGLEMPTTQKGGGGMNAAQLSKPSAITAEMAR